MKYLQIYYYNLKFNMVLVFNNNLQMKLKKEIEFKVLLIKIMKKWNYKILLKLNNNMKKNNFNKNMPFQKILMMLNWIKSLKDLKLKNNKGLT